MGSTGGEVLKRGSDVISRAEELLDGKENIIGRECDVLDSECGASRASPFYHRVIDNFLPPRVFAEICEKYSRTEFFPKHTDLFRFQQSAELKDKEEFGMFLKKIREEMKKDLENTGKTTECEEMDLFASFYEKGDFLLPHDDCLDERVFAFSFYLNRPEGEASETNGRLVLYENDGHTPSRYIEPVENRLVVFEVSPISFHEVEAAGGERKALTGWLRSKGYSPKSTELEYTRNRYFFFSDNEIGEVEVPERVMKIPFYEDMEPFRSVFAELKWKARLNVLYCKAKEPEENGTGLTRISLDLIVFKGAPVDELVIMVEKGGYMLLNDPFNTESDFLIVFSFYSGPIYLVKGESGEVLEVVSEEGMFIAPKGTHMFIPPAFEKGYVVAYRMNIEKVDGVDGVAV